MVDRHATTPTAVTAPDHADADRKEAISLALLLADQDARCADWTQALYALDAAVALSGGGLPAEYAEKRDRWSALVGSRPPGIASR